MSVAPSRTIQELRLDQETRLRQVIAAHWLTRLGAAGRDFQLEIPKHGKNSLVYLLDVDGGPSLALRIAPDRRHARILKQHRRAVALWCRWGLPTPKTIAADLSPRTRWKTGLAVLAEERVAGPNIVDCDADSGAFEALGRALARIHRVTRRFHHGTLFRAKLGSYAHHFLRRNRRKLGELVARGALTDPEQTQAARWFEGHEGDLRALRRHSLIHRRCTESDSMLDASGEAKILEPYRSGFGCFATDLVRAEERVCLGEEDKIGRLHRGYFEAAPESHHSAYRRLRPLFQGDFQLASAHRLSSKPEDDSLDGPSSRTHLDRFRAIISESHDS